MLYDTFVHGVAHISYKFTFYFNPISVKHLSKDSNFSMLISIRYKQRANFKQLIDIMNIQNDVIRRAFLNS